MWETRGSRRSLHAKYRAFEGPERREIIVKMSFCIRALPWTSSRRPEVWRKGFLCNWRKFCHFWFAGIILHILSAMGSNRVKTHHRLSTIFWWVGRAWCFIGDLQVNAWHSFSYKSYQKVLAVLNIIQGSGYQKIYLCKWSDAERKTFFDCTEYVWSDALPVIIEPRVQSGFLWSGVFSTLLTTHAALSCLLFSFNYAVHR